MTAYKSESGKLVRLGPTLGQGGEGTVHVVEGSADFAAKVFLPGLAAERHAKISRMIAAKLYASANFVAFPKELLFDQAGAFAGFTMLKVANRAPVHKLYSPTSRKTSFPRATYPLLLRTVSNVARAIASVHAAGCVVGDINHSGILVSDDATIVMIDADSFQLSYSGQVYPCKVGVPEFTPPELQGKNLAQVIRTANHDAFGLAVLIFYTLMMGRHPFAGRYLGSDDMSMERAISEFRFAYSVRRLVTRMEPPPNVTLLADLPPPLGVAFERAFGPEGATSVRATAKEWVTLLDNAEVELVACSQASAHHYFRSAPSCPWCRMERAFPGFRAFAPTFPTGGGAPPIDLGQLIATVRGIPDPGPAPDLQALMPAATGINSNPSIAKLKKSRLVRRSAAVATLMVGLICLTVPTPGPLIGLVAMVASAVPAFMPLSGIAAISGNLQRAQLSWSDVKRTYAQTAGNEHFGRVRRDAEALIERLKQNVAEENRRLAELNTRQQDAQFCRHLEAYDIQQVKIKGIGPARKLTLNSYGIETAFDLEFSRIVAIPGFGPSAANNLLAWRKTVEASFKFDPSQGVNPSDVVAIKAEIAQRNSIVQTQLSQTISQLRKASTDALAIRANPGKEAIQVWTDFKRAEHDEKDLLSSNKELAPLVVIAIGGMLALGVAAKIDHTPMRANRGRRIVHSDSQPLRRSPQRPGVRHQPWRRRQRCLCLQISLRRAAHFRHQLCQHRHLRQPNWWRRRPSLRAQPRPLRHRPRRLPLCLCRLT